MELGLAHGSWPGSSPLAGSHFVATLLAASYSKIRVFGATAKNDYLEKSGAIIELKGKSGLGSERKNDLWKNKYKILCY